MIEIKLTDEQQVKVSLAPVTPKGKPVEIDGTPVWEVSAGDVTLDVAEDGKSATIVSGGPGESIIAVSADADLGEGVETISDAIKVVVEGAKAQSLGVSVGTPELKP